VVALATVSVHFARKQYSFKITQRQIDEALRNRFPVTKDHFLIARITYFNPRVTLLPETDRVQVGIDARVDIKVNDYSKSVTGTALVASGLTYRSESKEFFLSNPQIEKFSIQGIPEQYLNKVHSVAEVFLREYLQRYPIYTLRPGDVRTTAATVLLKEVKVKGNEVDVTLGL